MNRKHHTIALLFSTGLLAFLSGCSTLGFAPYPVAHILTADTKRVLEQTPKRFEVPRELSKQVRQEHRLQPGDELLIEVVSEDSDIRLPVDQQVMADGSLDLAQFGRLVVASLSLEQAEALIQDRIAEEGEKPAKVNVRLIQPIHRYYVLGEVNSPGAYPLTGHETVLDALMEAGGLTARASACDLLLARPTRPNACRVTLPVCYRAITQLGDTSTNYHLKPGDRIFVARQSFCEELMAYFTGSHTCDRCCNCPKACRDPNFADPSGPGFMTPSFQTIPAPELSDPSALSSQTDGAPSGDAAAAVEAPQPAPSVQELKPPSEPASDLQPQQASPSDVFDGELDFNEVIRDE
jgi:protein involved in polysaccharide export with SLBB domain